MPSARCFPPSWNIEEANASLFIVKDNNGHALAYVYFEQDPGRRRAANLLTRDEARRMPPTSTSATGEGLAPQGLPLLERDRLISTNGRI
jgi:hypothetical protein